MKDAPDHTVLIASLALAAAIVAALIAAVSADIRQRRQLKHDRQMQDLAELRSVLDDATVAFEGALYALHDAFSGFGAISEIGSKHASDKDAEEVLAPMLQKQYSKSMRKCAAGRDRMIVAGQRIAIRVGDDDALCGTYLGAIDLVIDNIAHIYKEREREEAGAQIASRDFMERNVKLGAARKLFVAQAVARVRSQLP